MAGICKDMYNNSKNIDLRWMSGGCGNTCSIYRDKDSIANQSAISLIIHTTGICWNQVVCKGMAGNKGILPVVVKFFSVSQQSMRSI